MPIPANLSADPNGHPSTGWTQQLHRDGSRSVEHYLDGQLHDPVDGSPAWRAHRPDGSVQWEAHCRRGELNDPEPGVAAFVVYDIAGAVVGSWHYRDGRLLVA